MVDSGEERDRYLALLLYEQLKNHRKGVMVYGASHLNSLDPVIKQMFGDNPGEYKQLIRDDQQPIASNAIMRPHNSIGLVK